MTNEQQSGPSPVPQTPPTIRRGRAGERLRPRQQPLPESVVVSRGVLGSKSSSKPQTTRERRIAGDLPEWEPLPPGELRVHRRLG